MVNFNGDEPEIEAEYRLIQEKYEDDHADDWKTDMGHLAERPEIDISGDLDAMANTR